MRSLKAIMSMCVCGSGVLLFAGTRQDEKPQVIQKLLSKDPAQVNQARDELLSARRDLIEQLKRIIEDPNNRAYRASSVSAAIYLLGEMRTTEAIDVLVDHIGWPPLHKSDEPPHPDEMESRHMFSNLQSYRGFRSVDALVRIGVPAVEPVFQRLTATRNEAELKAYLGVLIWLCDRGYLLGRLDQLRFSDIGPDRRLLLDIAVRAVRDEPPVNERDPMWRRR